MKTHKIVCIFFYLTIISCNIYSFSGASISEEIKSFSLNNIDSQISNSPSSLSQITKDNLQDLILNQTNLTLLEESIADLNFSAIITKYEIKPIAINSNETAAKNRLTINLKVDFTNTKDENLNYKTTFSRYRDFESATNFAEIELDLINEITKELAEDTFNKAFVNW